MCRYIVWINAAFGPLLAMLNGLANCLCAVDVIRCNVNAVAMRCGAARFGEGAVRCMTL